MRMIRELPSLSELKDGGRVEAEADEPDDGSDEVDEDGDESGKPLRRLKTKIKDTDSPES